MPSKHQTLAAAAVLSIFGLTVSAQDCNSNGIPDSTDVAPTPVSAYLANGSCQSLYTFNFGSAYSLPEPDTDMLIYVDMLGFMTQTTSRYVDVLVNGVFVERLFENDGTNCPHQDSGIVTIPWTDIPDISTLVVSVDTQNAECCGPQPYLEVAVSYDLYSPLDLNQNGVVDSCGCFADLDADGDADIDDVDIYVDWYLNDDPRADFVDDETLNLDDLTAFTDAFTACS